MKLGEFKIIICCVPKMIMKAIDVSVKDSCGEASKGVLWGVVLILLCSPFMKKTLERAS